METIVKLLTNLGLAKSEIAIYLFGLKRDSLTVEEIQRSTKLKAPTVYHALNQLETKQLLTKQRVDGRLLYSFAPPEALDKLIGQHHAVLREQSEALQALLPLFPQFKQFNQAAITEAFQGHDQVRQAIDKALFCQSKQWDILSPAKNYLSDSEETYINYFKNMRVRNEIQSRSLWTEKVGNQPLHLADLITRKPRYLPDQYKGKLKSMMILYEDTTLQIGSYAQPVAQLTDSKELTDMMRLLFDALWREGKKAA